MSETELRDLVLWLADERQLDGHNLLAGDLREVLHALLISREALPFPGDVDATLHAIFAAEAAARISVDVHDLSPLTGAEHPLSRVTLWQGDITTLAADVIVNAANDRMLGCFVPGHRCIDNAIHRVAGPWLRADCQELMAVQGHPEPTGHAKVTSAHYLPAASVAHTVGPIVPSHQPNDEDAALLASCYTSCLDGALESGATSIAFCCISTGVFGYPIELAAPVAIGAVVAWLEAHPDLSMRVVFNTFSDHDTQVYRAELGRSLS